MQGEQETAKPKSVPGGRLTYIDVVKGFVMLLVVANHVLGGLRNGQVAGENAGKWLGEYSYSFFMPLMFLISGIFIERAYSRGVKTFASDKARTVLYPFVIWTLIHGSLVRFSGGLANHASKGNPLTWLFVNPVGPMWFFQTLLICLVLYAALRQVGLAPRLVVVAGLLTAIGSFWVPNDVLRKSLFDFLFFALGAAGYEFFTASLPSFPRMKSLTIGLVLLAVQIGIILTGGRRGDVLYVALPIALIGSAAVIFLLASIGDSPAVTWLKKMGEASLAIFVIHTLVAAPARIALEKVLHFHNFFAHIAIGLGAGIIVPMVIWQLSQKYFPWIFTWPKPKKAASAGDSAVAPA